jgi:hypothetical protein
VPQRENEQHRVVERFTRAAVAAGNRHELDHRLTAVQTWREKALVTTRPRGSWRATSDPRRFRFAHTPAFLWKRRADMKPVAVWADRRPAEYHGRTVTHHCALTGGAETVRAC